MELATLPTATTERLTLQDIAETPTAELEGLMWKGTTPDVENLVGWEFKGYNHPEFIEYLGFRKFVKGFFRPADAPEKVMGFNADVFQNGLYGKWLAKPADASPKRYGFYDVYPVVATERDNLYPHSLLLNYNSDRNPFYDVTRVLRDYLVQVAPDNPDLYLGKAYLALGPMRPAVSYFILERRHRHDYR